MRLHQATTSDPQILRRTQKPVLQFSDNDTAQNIAPPQRDALQQFEESTKSIPYFLILASPTPFIFITSSTDSASNLTIVCSSHLYVLSNSQFLAPAPHTAASGLRPPVTPRVPRGTARNHPMLPASVFQTMADKPLFCSCGSAD